jgi:hypothetical protein
MRAVAGKFPALQMMDIVVIAPQTRERGWRWKNRLVERLASKDIRGDMTKAGSGWITDAGLTFGLNMSGREKTMAANRSCAARRMMEGGITAKRTHAAMWT